MSLTEIVIDEMVWTISLKKMILSIITMTLENANIMKVHV